MVMMMMMMKSKMYKAEQIIMPEACYDTTFKLKLKLYLCNTYMAM